MPLRIEHQDGHSADYVYDASGVKLQMKNNTVGMALITKDYRANKVYENTVLKMILTEDGYVEPNSGSFNYYFYIKDHLGNNRVVADKNGTVAQITNYYPFGMSHAEVPARNDQHKQPYKFNGKELDRMFGLDTYDYSARMYSPAIGRFMTMDPLAEKYYSVSPYAYCLNNPIRYIDPTGMSTHTDSLGNVVAVYNDCDLGIYKHNSWDESNYSKDNTSAGGERMGRSLHTFSFINFDAFKENEKKINPMGKIDFESYSAMNEISAILDQDPSALDLYLNAGIGGDWDLKNRFGYYNGSVIAIGEYSGDKIYASGRDAGNFLAGAISDRSSIPDAVLLTGFGAYNLAGDNKLKILSKLIPAIKSKTFGEDKLSYEGIIRGMTLNRNYFPRR